MCKRNLFPVRKTSPTAGGTSAWERRTLWLLGPQFCGGRLVKSATPPPSSFASPATSGDAPHRVKAAASRRCNAVHLLVLLLQPGQRAAKRRNASSSVSASAVHDSSEQ